MMGSELTERGSCLTPESGQGGRPSQSRSGQGQFPTFGPPHLMCPRRGSRTVFSVRLQKTEREPIAGRFKKTDIDS